MRQRLRRGQESPRDALARIVGAHLANTWCDALGRLAMASACTPREWRRMRDDGRVQSPRYSARVRVDAVRKRRDESPEVVGPVLLLMHVWDHIRAGERRAWTRALWLGRPNLPPTKARGLSMALGVGVRELQRWLAALRTIGALTNWQPPGKVAPTIARTRRGRAYSCYAIPEYGEAWAAWQVQCARARQTTSDQQAHTSSSQSVEGSSSQPIAAVLATFQALIPDHMRGPPS